MARICAVGKAHAYLCVFILELVEVLYCCLLPSKSSNSGETLQCCGEVRVHWTSSCKYTSAMVVN